MTIARREVLKGGAAIAGLGLLPGAARAVPFGGKWRTFEIVTQIEILEPKGKVRAWVPLPSVSDEAWIRPGPDAWRSNGDAIAQEIAPYGARVLRIEWRESTATPAAEVRSRVATRNRVADLSRPGAAPALGEAERRLYTQATALIPTGGIVKDTADRITAGAATDLDKAHRIYDWIVVNTYRDPKVPGCGVGDIGFMLRTGSLGGKCADLNALFVGLARAVGLPARDLYGIRVAPSQRGFKSLGANSGIITKAQHCRAEVYLAGFGWIAADPADVRKVALEEPPGHLPLDDAKVADARATLFGAWEGNWIAYNSAHDVALPGAAGPRLGFLMYPQAETAAGRLDCLDDDAFRYTITGREIEAA